MKKNKKNISDEVMPGAADPAAAAEFAAEKAAKAKKRRIIDRVLTIFLALVIVVCGVNIGLILWRYKKANNMYDEIQNSFLVSVDSPNQSVDAANPDDSNVTPVDDDPFKVDFAALKDYNSDVIGWIYSEDTPISYPVAQTTDNEYYVRRSLDREYLITGTIFADYRCKGVGADQNYIIYGHHMRNGTIFGSLEKYADQAYYDAHPTLMYFTPEKTYVIDVVAGFVSDTSTDFFKVNFNKGERAKLIENARVRSGFDSSVEVGEDDTIVTLCTCSYNFEDARFLLIGKIHEK